MDDEIPDETESGLTSRAPEEEDLVALCRELNHRGARYLICGGFAVIHAGYPRFTGVIDLLIDDSLENEARVFGALEFLPDKWNSLRGSREGNCASEHPGHPSAVCFTTVVVANEETYAPGER